MAVSPRYERLGRITGVEITEMEQRLAELLAEWDFDDAFASLQTIEHDLDDSCECRVCRDVAELRARYG
jgi:hypothetical protein